MTDGSADTTLNMKKKNNLRSIFMVLMLLCIFSAKAQMYTGMTGMIQNPTAEMDKVGSFRIGSHFLNKHFFPEGSMFAQRGYHTFDFYASLTPFWWMEIGYTFTLMKGDIIIDEEGHTKSRYNMTDQYFSVKFSPLQEKAGKWWPSVAIGANDILTFEYLGGPNQYFGNAYIVATKNLETHKNIFGLTLGYRYYFSKYNKNWTGLVAGFTYRPFFYQNLRIMAEVAGKYVNLGADCLLFKHLLLQISVDKCQYPSGGIAFIGNLF